MRRLGIRHCRRCQHAFRGGAPGERYCGCQPGTRIVTCSECPKTFGDARRSGRPRLTCGVECSMRCNRRLAKEAA